MENAAFLHQFRHKSNRIFWRARADFWQLLRAMFVLSNHTRDVAVEKPVAARVQTVRVRGTSAIRRPLIILSVCAIASVGYVARDFLIPTAGAIVLELMSRG